MQFDSINHLTAAAKEGTVQGSVHAQVTQALTKTTKTGKPYLEITFADTEGNFTLKIWDNAPWRAAFAALQPNNAVELFADWSMSDYGVEAASLDLRMLTPAEEEALLIGSSETRARQEAAWEAINTLADSLQDPRLHALCRLFLDNFAVRFRRSGAARKMHHARRGGLVEHTAGTMRAADAICAAYPTLNRDLVLTGALLHDCGKMVENAYEEHSFTMPYGLGGELLGHITIGIELVNSLWKSLVAEHKTEWASLTPATEHVRLHLLHLLAAHHGTQEYGSPVVPKTPEALALHHADDLDAKMEMFRAAYESATALSDHVLQGKFPLPNAVKPLAGFESQD